jgi:DNA-binding LacI/PurR family transcriptional regulator
MGYRPDPVLSALSAYRRKNHPAKFQSVIAWVNHWNEPEQLRGGHREFDAYWRGAGRTADRLGYRLDEIPWPADCSVKRFERILLTRGVRGILIPPHIAPADWGGFDWGKFSIIRFGVSVPRPDTNCVTSDQSHAVLMALEHIREYGYRRIGLVAGKGLDRRIGGCYFGSYSFAQYAFQFEPALPPFMTDYGRHSPADLERQKRLFHQWLIQYRPDAILTTDTEVPGMIRALGCRIPQDVAVAGTSVLDIPVDAGIDQRSEDIGCIAVEMLVKQINVNELGVPATPCHIYIESRWQNGRSLPRRRVR